MQQVSNITQEAINRYYHTLSKLGYMNQNQLNSLIVLSYIDDFFDLFPLDITEVDYNTIVKAIECLAGNSCLIDFPTYEVYNSIIHKTKINFRPRITEDSIIRISEDSNVRIIQ